VVNAAEIQFAGDHEDGGTDVSEAPEASGATLSGLEQAVDGLQKAVGLLCLGPGYDALEVAAHHLSDPLHGADLRAYDAASPAVQCLAHDVDLLAIEDLAQPRLVDPGACGHRKSGGSNQSVEGGTHISGELKGVFEQWPTRGLEHGLGALLNDVFHLQK